jgi:hypothetical protein
MFKKRIKRATDEELDQAGKSLLWSAAAGDDQADEAARSPYLFTRIAARIEEEQRRRAASASGWLTALVEARRAIAALGFVTFISIAALLISANKSPGQSPAAMGASINLRPASVSACSLSSAEECVITNDDVLATMFAQGEGGTNR